jgi:hypothetical protein
MGCLHGKPSCLSLGEVRHALFGGSLHLKVTEILQSVAAQFPEYFPCSVLLVSGNVKVSWSLELI